MLRFRTETPVQTLSIQPQTVDPFVVLRASGDLDLQTQDEFERVVGRHLQSSPVIVDLSAVDFLAISALRSLIVCHRLAGSLGHELHYAGPSQQTLRLLSISGLDALLPVASSVTEAIADSPVAVGSADGVADQPGRHLAELEVG